MILKNQNTIKNIVLGKSYIENKVNIPTKVRKIKMLNIFTILILIFQSLIGRFTIIVSNMKSNKRNH